jgi:hypothetical protein
MKRIYEERMKAQPDDSIVVFLIGMRVRRWWKPHKWLPVAMAMPRMLRELDAHPELGYLGGEAWFGRTTIMVQYWRSREALYGYAKMRDAEHLPAWRKFNRRVGTDVGVWHETYEVPQTGIDSVYVNMPAFGLGKVASLQPARKHRAAPISNAA